MINSCLRRATHYLVSRAGWCAIASAWLIGLATTWSLLLNHAYQPALAVAEASQHVAIEPAPHFRVLVFAHPFCPCTRATLHELNESLSRLLPTAEVKVIFETVGLDSTRVEASPTVNQARQLHHVEVEFDRTGVVARRFQVSVSGEVLVFDPTGTLRFRGGITPSRGHQGDALGQRQLEQLVAGKAAGFCASPVYGCRLPTK